MVTLVKAIRVVVCLKKRRRSRQRNSPLDVSSLTRLELTKKKICCNFYIVKLVKLETSPNGEFSLQ